jgi:hypothetical protein
MSANVVADLLKQGITPREMARAIDADAHFIQRVQERQHTLTTKDLGSLAKLADTTPRLLLLRAIRPVKPSLQPLIDVVRRQLETSADFDARFRRKQKKRNRTRTKAA